MRIHPVVTFSIVFAIIAPVIAIAGASAGSPWTQAALFAASTLVAITARNGLRAVQDESEQSFFNRSGSAMRVITALTMIWGLAAFLAVASLIALALELSG